MGKSVTQPPSPNYANVATQQGAANVEAARASAKLSNPNIITPYGSQYVSYNGDTPTITQTLTPYGQLTANEEELAKYGLSITANNQQRKIGDLLSTPFSFNQTPQTTLPGNLPAASLGPSPNGYQQVFNANEAAPNLGMYGSAAVIDRNRLGAMNMAAPQAPTLSQGPAANQYGLAQTAMNEGGVAAMPVNAGMTAQNAIMSRLNPELQRQRTSTETQLINQGLRPGGEAYNNAATLLGQQENDARTQAALQGINLDLAANQQGFGQAQARGQFGNQGVAQNFSQALQSGQFGNEAQLASFGAGLQRQQAQNAAQQQGYQQEAGLTDSYNQMVQQQQQAALAQQQAGITGAGAQNQATQQNYQNLLQAQSAWNQGQQQQYGQALQSAQFGNAAQQQALQQALQQRQIPLNEIAALMSGSQIQTPQFQAYQGQTIAPTPVMQGAQAQGQWDQNMYNQQMAARNAMVQGLFSLGGTVGGALAGGFNKNPCWIAEALYGVDDPRTHLIRAYLIGPFSEHRFGRAVVWLYRRIGQLVAKQVRRSSIVRRLFRPLFDHALKAAERWRDA